MKIKIKSTIKKSKRISCARASTTRLARRTLTFTLPPMPAHRYVHRELVQFSDTDMAGIMHFANFFRFMERAEHAFFRSLGFSVMDSQVPREERVGWPRIHASCDYIAPLR